MTYGAVGRSSESPLLAVAEERLDAPKKLYACVFLLGIINNTALHLIYSTSQSLAYDFNKVDYMPYYGLVQLLSCILASALHARFGVAHFSFKRRTKFLLSLQGLSYFLLAISTAFRGYAVRGSSSSSTATSTLGFSISLVAAITSGSSQSIGEILVVSRCYHLPPATLGAWGIGSGVSGLVAPVLYALSKSAYSNEVGTVAFMLSLNVLIPIFYTAFMFVDQHNPADDLGAHEATEELQSRSEPLSLTTATRCMKLAGGGVLNFGAVYFLEYLITQSFLDRSTLQSAAAGVQRSLIGSNAYAISYAGYNLGVAVSRGVVGVMPNPPVALIWIPTLLQLINCTLWGVESKLHFVRYELFPSDTAAFQFYTCCMVFVGLMGGTSYSSCYAYFRDTPTIPASLREVLVNVSYGVSSIGMLSSSIAALILSKTVLSECSIYPCPQ